MAGPGRRARLVRLVRLVRLDSADPRGRVRLPGPARLGFGARSGGGPAGAGGLPARSCAAGHRARARAYGPTAGAVRRPLPPAPGPRDPLTRDGRMAIV
ncbi:hypothetical protein ADK51_03415 [Streptomyces sp. WM6368]|nr:hypothetical protein ADK51_03415 [Streptomyces sp. WM6368]